MPITPLRPNDPTSVGPYRLTGRLGAGAMGVVFLGHGGRGIAAAVKTLPAGVGGDVRHRMRREAQLLEQVRHPRVAELLAANTDSDSPWLAMRYVPGPSLAEATTPLPDPALRQLADGLQQALAALHSVGIIHRDVKPGNVILTYDGPVLVDLGIAAGHDLTAFTAQGMVVGTPSFMAPEQLRGEPLTPAVDTWGWGSVLYYAATGRPPFGDDAVPAIAYRIQHEPAATANLPDWLRVDVDAALSKNPHTRTIPSAPTDDFDTTESAAGRTPASETTIAVGRPSTSTTAAGTALAPAQLGWPHRHRPHWRWTALASALVLSIAGATGYLLTHPKTHTAAKASGTTPSASRSLRHHDVDPPAIGNDHGASTGSHGPQTDARMATAAGHNRG